MKPTLMSSVHALGVLVIMALIRDIQATEHGGSYLRDVHRVDSVWTSWSYWGRCSMTCGQGVRSRHRECVGQVGNQLIRLVRPSCQGSPKEYVVCQHRYPCPVDDIDATTYQCQQRNPQPVFGNTYQWEPFFGGTHNPCELTCSAKGFSFYYNFGHVEDGTKCTENGDEICVNGFCSIVGCDEKVGSVAEVDRCGVCGGGNVDCIHYRGQYSAAYPQFGSYGYLELTRVPAGAKDLMVTDNSNNYLALTSDHTSGYIINGNYIIDSAGKYNVAGTTITYSKEAKNESLSAVGPINVDLRIMLLFRDYNPGINIEYWITKDRLPRDNGLVEVKPESPSDEYDTKDTASPNRDSIGNDGKPLIPGSNGLPYEEQNDNGGGYRNQNDPYHPNTKPKESSLNNGRYDVVGNSGPRDQYTAKHTPDSSPESRLTDNTHSHSGHQRDRHGQSDTIENQSQSKKRPRPTKAPQKNPSQSRIETGYRGHLERRKKPNIDTATCGPCKKTKNRSKQYCSSDFVIRGKILKEEYVGNETRYEVRIIQNFRGRISLLTLEYIWVPNQCYCPRMKVNKEYILMGVIGTIPRTRESRLEVNRKSFVRFFNDANARRMHAVQKKVKCNQI